MEKAVKILEYKIKELTDKRKSTKKTLRKKPIGEDQTWLYEKIKKWDQEDKQTIFSIRKLLRHLK